MREQEQEQGEQQGLLAEMATLELDGNFFFDKTTVIKSAPF